MARRTQNRFPIIEAEYVVRRPPRRSLRWAQDAFGMAQATYGLWGLVVRLLIAATLLAIGCVIGFTFAMIAVHRP